MKRILSQSSPADGVGAAFKKPADALYDPVCGEGRYILTPSPSPKPRINGPSVFGVRPGAPFFYSIPATGIKPMRYDVEGLPLGLQVDRATGLVSGKITDLKPREYAVTLHAENRVGKADRQFTIVVGDTICLTPPMGWNSWNCWGVAVNQQHVLDSAVAMASKGLKDFGWSYVNIDDAWQGKRGGKHLAIQPDPSTFPDLARVCAEIHAMGLKVGIYSSPWITTYAGRIGGSSDHESGWWNQDACAPHDYRETKRFYRVGRYRFDENDAAQWAEWGIDYLKYDWHPNDPESTLCMAEALQNCGRDIVYSLSNSAPLEHADIFARVANCWRTTFDLKDRWDQPGPHQNVMEQWAAHRKWMENGFRGGPGHFPDADMLVVGNVGTSTTEPSGLRPSRLTADEQYSHLSLWVLWSCPLLIGCPIETMDDFTLNLLTNADVLEVHQDAAAVPGMSIGIGEGVEMVVKDLSDGSKAIGLFNTTGQNQVVSMEWDEVGLKGPRRIRDLWRQQDIGVFDERFLANVRPHGVVLVRSY